MTEITEKCKHCKGTGTAWFMDGSGQPDHDVCPICDGSGEAIPLPEPEEEAPAVSFLDIEAYDVGEGRIEAYFGTNDNFDQGYPNQSATWIEHYHSYEDFIKRAGISRTGCSGIRVTVRYNGKKI